MPRTSEAMAAASAVAAAGLKLSPAGADNLETIAPSIVQIERDKDGRPIRIYAKTEDAEVSVEDWVGSLREGNPGWFAATAHVAALPANATMTQRAVHANATAKATKLADKTAVAASVVERFGNPWLAGHANMTHQALIENGDAALAARLRKEASL